MSYQRKEYVMGENNQSLLDLVNGQGFLFQMRVAEEIKYITIDRCPIITEHRWVDIDTKLEGFIDIIVIIGYTNFVFECKRVKEGNWIFLVPEVRPSNGGDAYLFWMLQREKGKYIKENDLVRTNYEAYYSAYSIMRGQDNNSLPLEKWSGNLLRSVEALIVETSALKAYSPPDWPYLFIPIIVTNAHLLICKYQISNINLETGTLPDVQEFEEVPFVQFRKSLSTTFRSEKKVADNLSEAGELSQRSVFVVNISGLRDFLVREPIPQALHRHMPWTDYTKSAQQ